MQGYVYCLTNATMPGLVKIGRTARNPATRAAEISASTGVATPFNLEWSRRVDDMASAESDLHGALSRHRLNKRREFFRCTPALAYTASKTLGSFRKKPQKRSIWKRPRKGASRKSDRRLGLSLIAVTLLIFTCAIMFDLDTSTIATAIATIGIALSLFFQNASQDNPSGR